MADYEQPDDVDVRLRYYDNQILKEQDFIDEQKYHIGRQRWHDRFLHTPGIVEGLEVTHVTGTSKVLVSKGTAVDAKGRHILLTTEVNVELKEENERRLYLCFHEEEGRVSQEEGASGATRFLQKPQVFFPKKGDSLELKEWVLLAELKGTGTTIQGVDTSVRQYAGVRLPGPVSEKAQTLRSSADGRRAELTGSLSVSESLQVLGAAGIKFPPSLERDDKDAASIRYFADQGKPAMLRIGTGSEQRDALCLHQGGKDQLTIQEGNVEIPNVLRVGSGPFNNPAQVSIRANGHLGGMLALENAEGQRVLHVGNDGALQVNASTVKVNGYAVARASEGVRIIRGSVNVNNLGTRKNPNNPPDSNTYGLGWKAFSVRNDKGYSEGIFEIEFLPPFPKGEVPTLTLTTVDDGPFVIDSEWEAKNFSEESGLNSSNFYVFSFQRFILILGINHKRAFIKTMNPDGTGWPRNFHFIAMGSAG